MKGLALVSQLLPIIIVPILIIAGLIAVSEFHDSINVSDYSTDAQTAINTTMDNTYSAFNLALITPPIGLIILIVCLIGGVIGAVYH